MFNEPHRLHPAAILINFGAYFKRIVSAVIIPLVVSLMQGVHSRAEKLALIGGGVVMAVGAISLIGPVLHFFSTYYVIEGDALVISSGFVWRKRRTIPLARVQNVNIERSIWHRLLGAAALKVETAAGKAAEGDLTALSLEDANKLQAVILRRSETEEAQEVAEKPKPLFELSPKQVLLAGALGNRVMYIIAGILGAIQFEKLGDVAFKPVVAYIEKLNPIVGAFLAAGAFVGLVIVGWIVSIVVSATRFYGFRAEKHERGLLLTHGLITQFRNIVPVGRIQVVRILQPVMFRIYGYCEMFADTAGSFDAKDAASANMICPLLQEAEIDRVGRLLIPEFEFTHLDWKKVSRKTISRNAVRRLVAYLIFIILPLAFWLHFHALWFLLLIVPYCIGMGFLHYQFDGYALAPDMLASRSGVFRRKTVLMPFDRVQHYTINSSVFQRLMGLASIEVVSGSSSGHTVMIGDLDVEVARQLRQALGSAIQSHIGSRKGGL